MSRAGLRAPGLQDAGNNGPAAKQRDATNATNLARIAGLGRSLGAEVALSKMPIYLTSSHIALEDAGTHNS